MNCSQLSLTNGPSYTKRSLLKQVSFTAYFLLVGWSHYNKLGRSLSCERVLYSNGTVHSGVSRQLQLKLASSRLLYEHVLIRHLWLLFYRLVH